MRTPMPPRLRFWRGDWYVFMTDRATRKQKRVKCAHHDAHNPRERAALLKSLKRSDREAQAAVVRLGHELDFERPMREAVGWFLEDAEHRAELRASTGGREGLARASVKDLHEKLDPFKAWLPASLPTGRLDGHTLARFIRDMGPGRSSATLNGFRRAVKTCLRWLTQRRPRLFPDPEIFWPALRLTSIQAREAAAYTPAQLGAFFDAMPQPQRRLMLMLALTGARIGEVLALRWADIDLTRARVTIHAAKTGRTRILPLAGAPEGEVAPGLLLALRSWDHASPPAGATRFSLGAWRTAARRSNVAIMPQALRRNFTSYAASLGIPPAVSAMWQGHSVVVAERFYRQQVLERIQADSIEAAMGLSEKTRATIQPAV